MQSSHSRRAAQGFTLVEIMVGMVIGMIGMIIMLQLFASSEERVRTSGGSNDALTNGAIALNSLQREISHAGYGIAAANLLGCNITLNGATVPLTPVTINAAATVVPAGDANTDTLLIVHGDGNGEPQGNVISSISGKDYTVQAPTSFQVNDYVVAVPDTCSANLVLDRITAVTATTVTVSTGTTGATALYNLGQAPKILAYAVRSNMLSSCDYLASDCRQTANWSEMGGNIVALRAQYGWGHNATQTDASGNSTIVAILDNFTNTAPGGCNWPRVPAIRFALVARSTQYETRIDSATGKRVCDAVTANAPTWTGSTADNPTGSTARAFDLSDNDDWQCYRYKSFETVVPLRNIVWMGVTAGC